MAAVVTMLLSGFVTPVVSRVEASQHSLPLCTQDSTTPRPTLEIHDTMRTTYSFTEGIKSLTIKRDTAEATRLFKEALALDSTYAPALFQLAQIEFFKQEQAGETGSEVYEDYARRAYQCDTMSRWYTGLYGHALVINRKIDQALDIYKRLIKIDSRNAENYRILAILYQFRNQPYSALSILDSADVRFGKQPHLQELKRRLLISTRQFDRAIEEAQQVVDQAPYDQMAVLTLGQTYIEAGEDSLAKATLQKCFKMDSTNVDMLTTYADYLYRKQDTHNYMRLLHILFKQREFPESGKLQLLNQFMSNRAFYGEYYYSIGDLLTSVLILNPKDKKLVDLYGNICWQEAFWTRQSSISSHTLTMSLHR